MRVCVRARVCVCVWCVCVRGLIWGVDAPLGTAPSVTFVTKRTDLRATPIVCVDRRSTTLNDLQELRPAVAQSLRDMLGYDAEELEETSVSVSVAVTARGRELWRAAAVVV